MWELVSASESASVKESASAWELVLASESPLVKESASEYESASE